MEVYIPGQETRHQGRKQEQAVEILEEGKGKGYFVRIKRRVGLQCYSRVKPQRQVGTKEAVS